MKKLNLFKTTLILFILFISSGAEAASSVWSASSSSATVYLAGSFHMLRESDYPLPAEFFTAYRNSAKLVFEVPPGEAETTAYLTKFISETIYNDGTTLKDHVTPAAYAKAERFCKEHDYPMEQYKIFKPTFFMMSVTVSEMNKIGVDPKNGVDYFFKNKAAEDGKAVGSLETLDQQIDMLASIDASIGSDQIMQGIDELGQMDTMLSRYLSAWRRGDEAKMEDMYIKGLKEYPKLYRTLIVERNNKWLSDIEGYLKGSRNIMVIVGAAHLVGDDGLVNLLRKRGYKVTQLQK